MASRRQRAVLPGRGREDYGGDVTTGTTIQAGTPQLLFDTRLISLFARFAVAANGQRFLVPVPVSEASASPATVVINWTAGIKR